MSQSESIQTADSCFYQSDFNCAGVCDFYNDRHCVTESLIHPQSDSWLPFALDQMSASILYLQEVVLTAKLHYTIYPLPITIFLEAFISQKPLWEKVHKWCKCTYKINDIAVGNAFCMFKAVHEGRSPSPFPLSHCVRFRGRSLIP